MDTEVERLRGQLREIQHTAALLAGMCIDGQNQLHGIKHGGMAKRTLKEIENRARAIVEDIAANIKPPEKGIPVAGTVGEGGKVQWRHPVGGPNP